MKIWISPYQLISNMEMGKKRHRGFLIRLQEGDFEYGYADCFPWRQFGDPFIGDLVNFLKTRKSHDLLDQSLEFARIDGQARQKKISLWQNFPKITNHYILPHVIHLNPNRARRIIEEGFETIKVKLGEDTTEDLKRLQLMYQELAGQVKLRLDFNGRYTSDYSDTLAEMGEFIEFIEDPFEKVDENWSQLKAQINIPLALDQATWEGEKPPLVYDLQVVKPAKQGPQSVLSDDVVYTSYMDHPVGQAFALYFAGRQGPQKRDYGLMSQHIYRETPFSDCFISEGNSFRVGGGYGIGFDDALKRVRWLKVY